MRLAVGHRSAGGRRLSLRPIGPTPALSLCHDQRLWSCGMRLEALYKCYMPRPLIWCYKVVFGIVRINTDQFFRYGQQQPFSTVYKYFNSCAGPELYFFIGRVINTCYKLPASVIDFITLSSFKTLLNQIDIICIVFTCAMDF